MNLFKSMKELKQAMDDCKNKEKEILSDSKSPDSQKKEQIVSNYEKWLDDENAKWFRNQCKAFMPYIFPTVTDYEKAFGNTLNKFFLSHGNWRPPKQFTSMHVDFLMVNALELRDIWNRRDINLKEILLNELCDAYVYYASTKGFFLNNICPHLISRVWLIKGKLIIECPTSDFPINYSRYCGKFIPQEYWQFIEKLDALNEL